MTGKRALLTILAACSAVAAMAGGSNDKMTALPLHPGLSSQQEVNSSICGKKASINLYDAPFTSKTSEYMEWYRAHLKGFHYVHQVWSNRAQEMFYSPDGSSGVTITGVPDGDGVFAVSYEKLSGTLTTHQMDAFSPQNPSCR